MTRVQHFFTAATRETNYTHNTFRINLSHEGILIDWASILTRALPDKNGNKRNNNTNKTHNGTYNSGRFLSISSELLQLIQ